MLEKGLIIEADLVDKETARMLRGLVMNPDGAVATAVEMTTLGLRISPSEARSFVMDSTRFLTDDLRTIAYVRRKLANLANSRL